MKNSLKATFNEAEKNYKIIAKTHKILEKTYDMKIQIHSAGQWILDNMYIIEQEYDEIKESRRILKNKKLPVIKTNNGDKCISIFFLAYELVEKNTGYIDKNIILNCLKEHQKLSYLTSEELDLFVLMLKMALLKFIARICVNISNSQMRKMEVEKILSNENLSTDKLVKELYHDFNFFKGFNKTALTDYSKIKHTNTALVEYMAYRLKELGPKGESFFNILTEEADKIGFTVEEAIVKEHMEIAKTTDYIGRAILAYKQLQGLNFREIFEKVNKIDETLRKDYTNEFKKCDYKTKGRYRSYIIRLAKKYNLSEAYVAKKAVECSHKYKKHVGFFLIGEEKYLLKKELNKSYFTDRLYYKCIQPIKAHIYISFLLLIAALITYFVGRELIHFEYLGINIFFYIIAFVFSLEASDKILSYLLRKMIHPKVLPRFDFAKTVDKKYPTYVVMPTVISSVEKLDDMIKKMEVTYLSNRSENMYYMLLGDCISSDRETISIDKKIVEYAKKRLDELNEKYESEHKIFNFIYRKRVYSKGEGCYMGWERKRGALSQFNKLILGNLSQEEISRAMYLIYDDIMPAKYAITMDEDSQLSLNTAKDLVSIIAHPLNQPVLSQNGKIVEKGYGLITPSVGLDIEAANKSIFSKIFGGVGGLDIYTNAIANVYQDVFGEAIFCGKGIYNIELFEKLLGKEIPENLVLSHDLLEGSFIRAGLASDVELQDGFPNNYIAYMKRNHRWYRGDMQIIRWLISPKSKLNILSKWKIFDNLRRPLLDVFALIAIIVSIFVSKETFIVTTLLSFVALNFGYVLSIIDIILYGKVRHTKDVQYIPIIHGASADFLTMCFHFVTMPYRAYNCISAFTMSLYRMLISKKNLLQWTTGEMLEKSAKDSLSYYYSNMFINVIVGLFILFVPFALDTEAVVLIDFKIFVAISFLLGPMLCYLLGKDHLVGRIKPLEEKEKEEVLEVAKRTWTFFDTMMSPTNNYLPTDNFQENRRHKIANRTSSTNIGFGILAIIDAYDLGFINKADMIKRLENIYNTIEKLETWNGHLYNWYNIKTLEPLRPRFVSTVDSGNFISCLYVAREFLYDLKKDKSYSIKDFIAEYQERIDGMLDITESIIEEADFSKLYDTSRNLFSIGYAVENGTLVDSYYDMLMSESRTTSLIAIASKQVTSKHWFALARNLVSLDGYKGLISWTGTAFEYFMPFLFNKSYEHTLIDQSLFFTKYSQLKYAKANNVAWGISESAYAVKDDELNYQYKAFGIPWLGLKRGLNDSLVISPYSSILMIEIDPVRVYKNMNRLKELGLYSSYGFYESIDYTKENLHAGAECEIAKTYMAHHQGMILTAINNYINHGVIKSRFHSNPNIKACEILLKERERIKANIKKGAKDKENKFKQKNTQKYTTYVSYTYADRKYITPNDASNKLNIAFLKGSHLSSMISNNGASFLRYKDKIVNRQRYTELETSGNFVYLTDKTTGNTISVTDCNIHSKFNKNTDKCKWVSSLNNVECTLVAGDLETATTISISPEFNAEMKKISVYNNGNTKKEIIINTYVEPAMTDYMTGIVHPSFSNLQIETYYDEDLDVLVASKRKKSDDDKELYVFAKLVGIDLEKEVETEKQKLFNNDETSYDENIVRYPLWPVLSYRARIILEPYERQEFYYVLGVADSRYKISNAILNLDKDGIEDQCKLTNELNSVVARYLKLEPTRAEVYNNILKDVLIKKSITEDEKFWDENLNQSALWKYSISGDLPIILVHINKIEDAGIINEVINFMDYVKNRKIDLDIIVLIDEPQKQDGPIYRYIKTRIDRAVYMEQSKGDIYILNISNLTKQEITLLTYLSRRYIQNISEFLCFEKNEESATEKATELLNENTKDNMEGDMIDGV
ncbi:MAG: glucoamylase family protein [Clostridia bacterium]|nr:glucoamylase family protein [Clostridia bacterium]